MKNPWKSLSKISPQVEDGHCRINNDLLQRLISWKLSGSQLSLVLYIWRKTWGFNKKEDAISISQFQEATLLSDRGIRATLKELRGMKIIHYEQTGPLKNGSALNVYLFNKHWDTWKARPLNNTSPLQNKVPTPEKKGTRPLNNTSGTINKYTKDTLTKDSTMLGAQTFKKIIEDLNKKAGRNYLTDPDRNSSAYKLILSRLKKGFLATDFYKVHSVKAAQWKGDEKMDHNLKPKTLYAECHFADYLGEYKPQDDPAFKRDMAEISRKYNDNSEVTELRRCKAMKQLYIDYKKVVPVYFTETIIRLEKQMREQA